jgi:hypothetical protein
MILSDKFKRMWKEADCGVFLVSISAFFGGTEEKHYSCWSE